MVRGPAAAMPVPLELKLPVTASASGRGLQAEAGAMALGSSAPYPPVASSDRKAEAAAGGHRRARQDPTAPILKRASRRRVPLSALRLVLGGPAGAHWQGSPTESFAQNSRESRARRLDAFRGTLRECFAAFGFCAGRPLHQHFRNRRARCCAVIGTPWPCFGDFGSSTGRTPRQVRVGCARCGHRS